MAATGPSPFKVGDNQRPERAMSGVVRGWLSLPSLVEGCREGNPAGMNSYGDRLHFSKRIAVLNS